MSRVVAFSLKLEGSTTTIAELSKINKALDSISDQIKGVKKIDTSAFVNLTKGQDIFKKAINETNKLLDAQLKNLDEISKSKGINTTIVDKLTEDIKKLQKEIATLKAQLSGVQSPTIKVATPEGLEKIAAKARESVAEIAKMAPAFEALSQGAAATFLNSIAAIDLKLQEVKNNIRSVKSGDSPTKTQDLSSLLTQERSLLLQKKELTTQIKEEEKAFIALSHSIDPTSVVGMRNELNKLKKEFLNLDQAARESQEGLNKLAKIQNLNSSISAIEQSTGNFTRNVGNYRDAINGLIPTLERLQKEGAISRNSLAQTFRAQNVELVESLKREINQLVQSYDKLTEAEKKSGAGIEAFNNLTRKADELNSAVKTIPHEVGNLKKSFLSLGDLITGGLITGGILAAAGALKAFGSDSIHQFTEAETAIKKVNAQLIATGNASGKTSEGIIKIAKELEIATGIDDDNIIDQVSSKLLTFGRIQGETFDRAQKNAIDLAQVMGGDLGGAATLIGKALDNPIRGLTILAKAGISFDEATQKQIKDAIKANDIFKAQALILGGVESRVKGVSDSINNSDLKGIRRITFEFNDFKEEAGKVLVSLANDFIDFGKALSNGTFNVPVGLKQTKIATDELTASIAKEQAQIESGFQALKDDNTNKEVRKNIISQIASKYSELVSQEELEVATLQELDEIQKNLTATVRKEIIERIKLATQEAIQTEIIQNKIKLAYAKRQDASGFKGYERYQVEYQKFFKGEKQTFEALVSLLESDNKKLEEESKKTASIFNDSEFNTDKIEQTYLTAGNKIKAIILKVSKALTDKTLSKEGRIGLQDINKEFSNLKVNEFSSDEDVKRIIERSNKVDGIIKQLTAKHIGLVNSLSDETKAASDKASKDLEDQLKRIEALRQKIRELNASSIDNKFDKEIEDVKIKVIKDLHDIQLEIDKVNEKKIKTSTDLEEIKVAKSAITELRLFEEKEIKRIEVSRAKALNDAKNELLKLKAEIDAIISTSNKDFAESKVTDLKFNLEQSTRKIEIQYTTDLQGLKSDLAKGAISEKEFKEKSAKLSKDKLDKELGFLEKYRAESIRVYDLLFKAQLQLAKAGLSDGINKATEDAIKAREELQGKIKEGSITPFDALQTGINISIKEFNQKKALQEKYNDNVKKLGQDRANNEKEVDDKILANHTSSNENQNAEDQKLHDLRKERIKELAVASIEVAQRVSDAIFEISKNNNERDFKHKTEQLDKERNARLKLVKGNAAEEERINREFDAKKRKLDQENFERQKRASITQAIVNGALAITSVFANNVDPTFVTTFIKLGVVLASVAAQIAVIRSQSFAKGGFVEIKHGHTGGSSAPRDNTGERPVGNTTVHEGEYFIPRKMVESNRDLVDAFEQNRRVGNTGKIPKAMILKAIEAHEKRIPVLNAHKVYPMPILYGANYFSTEKQKDIQFSDEAINKIAHVIATKAELAIEKGISKGYSESVKKITQDELRKHNLHIKRAI
ncbi:MAG: phage tail length tape measure family protein [Saprospiraceae bacterium]